MIEEKYITGRNSNALWNAVFAVALGVSGLIVSEFLPVSLLTPMAKDLHISEGVAGQAISVTAIVAMFSSLFVAIITQKIDRRKVLLSFCFLQILSNLFVANAANFTILLIGRILLGIGIGGFWSMAAATAMRLVPSKMVPKALTIVYGFVSLATVAAAPLGSYLGVHIGWRKVFLISGAIGVIALIWQAITLPSMPSGIPSRLNTLLHVLKRPFIKGGLLATTIVFISYSTYFTYLRPFLESVTIVNNSTLSLILLGFGLTNLIGSYLSRFLLEWNIYRSLSLAPLCMGIILIALVIFGHLTIPVAILFALLSMVFSLVQVGWTAWLIKTIPDEAESGGGIQIAVIQLAITIGAGIGGLFFGFIGASGVYMVSGIIAIIASLVAVWAFRKQVGKN